MYLFNSLRFMTLFVSFFPLFVNSFLLFFTYLIINQAALRTSFSEYGPVDRVYVVPDKAIAFVRCILKNKKEEKQKGRGGESDNNGRKNTIMLTFVKINGEHRQSLARKPWMGSS